MQIDALSLAFGSIPYSRVRKFFLEHIPTPESVRGPKGGSFYWGSNNKKNRLSTNYWDENKQKKHIISNLLSDQLAVLKEKEFSGPIETEIVFCFPFSRNIPLNKRNDLLGKPFTSKPSLQHLIDMYLDCAYDAIISKDAILVALNAKKVYGDPGIFLIIKEL
jgi:hypothetical protein